MGDHEPYKETIVWQEVKLERNQFIYTQTIACKVTKLTPQEVRTCLKKLQSMKKIISESTNKFTIITVANQDVTDCLYIENNNQTSDKKQPNDNQEASKDQPKVIQMEKRK